jgi:hypothetical protein
MLARLVYLACGVCLVGLAIFAVVIPEAFGMQEVRLIVATLVLAVIVACWWISRRTASVIGPRILACVAVTSGVVGAFWFRRGLSARVQCLLGPSLGSRATVALTNISACESRSR